MQATVEIGLKHVTDSFNSAQLALYLNFVLVHAVGEGRISLLIVALLEYLIITLRGGYKLIDAYLERHDRLLFDLDMHVVLLQKHDNDVLQQAKLLF